jgi:hypothetical protein
MNLEWAHVIVAIVSAIAGGGAGLVAGVWRVAHIEQALRIDFQKSIDEAETKIEGKVEELVGQFTDTFAALRQKINDVELHTEQRFVSKAGFDDFRREYREDMSSLMKKIDHITVRTDR